MLVSCPQDSSDVESSVYVFDSAFGGDLVAISLRNNTGQYELAAMPPRIIRPAINCHLLLLVRLGVLLVSPIYILELNSRFSSHFLIALRRV